MKCKSCASWKWSRRNESCPHETEARCVQANAQMAEAVYTDLALQIVNRAVLIDSPTAHALLALRADRPEAYLPYFGMVPMLSQQTDPVRKIRVRGVLMNGGWYSDYEDIKCELDAALEDPTVESVLFCINSPGGTVSGLFELTDYIYSKRGEKPMWAIAADQATSAAYAIAASTDHIVATQFAPIGSIGAIVMHTDLSEAAKKEGYKFTEIASGKHKTDLSQYKPLNPDGRERMQRTVDLVMDKFAASVSEYRGIDEQAIRDMNAAVYMGDEVVSTSLADEIATVKDTVERLAGGAKSAASSGPGRKGAAMAATNDKMKEQPGATTADPTAQAAADAEAKAKSDAEAKAKSDAEAKAAADAQGAQVIDITAARSTERASLIEQAKQITQACAIAGHPELAGGFISEGVSLSDAQKQLLELKAKETSGGNVDGKHNPNAGANLPNLNPMAVYQGGTAWNRNGKES